MENQLIANSSALAIADTCVGDCDISAENLAVAECALRVLDNAIEKIQIAMIIPAFLDDQELLRQCLSKSQFQKCIKYYNQYMRHAESIQGSDRKPLHIALIELIDLFCENHSIRKILPEHLSKIPDENKELIDALLQLRKIAEARLKTTAAIEMQREKAIHRIYQDNENTMQSLTNQKQLLHDQEINLRWKLSSKQATIKKYEEELATKKWENNLKIKQEILKSSHTIREFHAQSLLKQEQLTEELEKARILYERDLKTNMKIEKEIRDEKNKLLIQLQGLIRKYDQNIGEKIQENSELQKTFDEQRRILDEFFVEYSRQENEYNELALKKLNEETAEFERKLMRFMTNRAAKVIQRSWRKLMKSKKKTSKTKGGKGKGKKNKKK